MYPCACNAPVTVTRDETVYYYFSKCNHGLMYIGSQGLPVTRRPIYAKYS
jgi:hypothetical protein